MEEDTFCLLQLTDTHQFAKTTDTLLGVNTERSLNAVLDLIQQTLKTVTPDLVALTGDISQDASRESYQRMLEKMQFFSSEIAWIPGNHDLNDHLATVLGPSYLSSEKYFIKKNWQIIFLDSHIEKKSEGFLEHEQLDFLQKMLSLHQEHALIIMHHHILPLGAAWLDNLNVQNNQDFLAIIDRFKHVKAVLSGHVHHDSEKTRNHVKYFTSPSSCIQFKTGTREFSLDPIMPGFSLFFLHNDGRIERQVKRIPHQDEFIPNLTSKGYV